MPQHRLPATGIHGPSGLSTDVILAGFVGIAISGLDVAYSGDDGGWKIVASGARRRILARSVIGWD